MPVRKQGTYLSKCPLVDQSMLMISPGSVALQRQQTGASKTTSQSQLVELLGYKSMREHMFCVWKVPVQSLVSTLVEGKEDYQVKSTWKDETLKNHSWVK